nr:hypothetical protein [uncultured Undibacterium sp.]
MSLLDFRNSFISKVMARLNATNLSTATDSELLVNGALFKQLDAINKIDPISIDALRIIENLTGEELDAYAVDPSSRTHVQNILKDTAIMSAIAQSASTMEAIARSKKWVNAINAEPNAISICNASTTAMNALASNLVSRTAIGTTNAFFLAIKTNSMSYAKLIAGHAGLNPTNYADLVSLYAIDTDVNTIVSNGSVRTIIGSSGLAFDTAKTNSMVIAKLIAAYAGLNPATYADLTALSESGSAMTIIASNTDALNILALSNTALTSVFNRYPNRTLLWNSAVAITILIGTSNSQNYLLGSATSINFNPGASPTVSSKKAWMLRVYSAQPSTSGSTYYKYNLSGGSNNADNIINTGYTAESPYLVPASLAKVAFPQIYNTFSGATPNAANYTYIQMEA